MTGYKSTHTQGKRVLAYHSYPEWADIIEGRLLDLGCSEQYAAAEKARIIEEGKR